MSSTTIRYSTLPENSQSISLASAYQPPSDDHHASPGAYRYDPDTYDPSIPDSDPRSPRYEPPHLRHQPGDTYEIGGKPHDPLDPGPYGTPGWYQDQRTGRHRRGELPDPLPSGHDEQQRPAGKRPRSSPSPAPSFTPSPTPAPETAPGSTPVDSPAPEVAPAPTRAPASAPRQQHRRRYWSEPEPETGTGPGTRTDGSGRFDPEPDEPYRFSKLREDAWDRWLIDSEPLAAAHRIGPTGRNRRTAIDRECGPAIAAFVRLIRWIVAVVKGPAPDGRPVEPSGPTEPPTASINVSELEARALPHRIRPPHQLPLPRTGNGFIGSWELQFDARQAATGGGLA